MLLVEFDENARILYVGSRLQVAMIVLNILSFGYEPLLAIHHAEPADYSMGIRDRDAVDGAAHYSSFFFIIIIVVVDY